MLLRASKLTPTGQEENAAHNDDDDEDDDDEGVIVSLSPSNPAHPLRSVMSATTT